MCITHPLTGRLPAHILINVVGTMHPHQQALLRYLETLDSLEGVSYWRIARETNLNNAQTVKHHLIQLEKKGYLRKDLNNPKNFKILQEPVQDVVYINLYGFANCGNGSDIFSEENLTDRIAISTKLLGIADPNDYFAVKARGDSMVPEISNNDIVIIRRAEDVESGSFALIVDNGDVKIKQLIKNYKQDSSVEYVLKSLNRASHKDKVMSPEDNVYIAGLVKGVIHAY